MYDKLGYKIPGKTAEWYLEIDIGLGLQWTFGTKINQYEYFKRKTFYEDFVRINQYINNAKFTALQQLGGI